MDMNSENNQADPVAKPFFVQRSNKVFGPFSLRQIEKGKLDGKFLSTDKVATLDSGPWHDIATADLQALTATSVHEPMSQEVVAAEVVREESATAESAVTNAATAEVVMADIVKAPQALSNHETVSVATPTWKFVAAMVGSGIAACFGFILFISWAFSGSGGQTESGTDENGAFDVASAETTSPSETETEAEPTITPEEKARLDQALAEFGQVISEIRGESGAEAEVNSSDSQPTNDDSYSELDASLLALGPDEACDRAQAMIADTSADSLRTAYLLAHKAASSGNVRAKFILGMCYFAGWGVDKDEASGMYWVEAASNEGEPQAMYLVAGLIQEGRYPDKGMPDILQLLNRSAEAGYTPAADALNEFKVQQVNGLIGALFLSAFSSGDSESYEDSSSMGARMIERRNEETRYWTSRAESAALRGDQAEYEYSKSKIP